VREDFEPIPQKVLRGAERKPIEGKPPMNHPKVVFIEEIKECLRNRKVIFIILISLLVFLTVYASSFIQLLFYIFFKPGKIPLLISFVYHLLFILIPTITLFIGYDMVSFDVENSLIRTVISKISRLSYILGKFFALFSISAAFAFISLASAAVYTFIKFHTFDLLHPLLFFLFLLPYIAACSAVVIFFSSLYSKTSFSLMSIAVFYFLLIYLSIGNLSYLSLFHYSLDLSGKAGAFFILIPEFISLPLPLIAVIVFMLYFFVFISSTVMLFQRRDL
jgi:ABC-type transport system involved in multi-copper enzyme maturation permease subunit